MGPFDGSFLPFVIGVILTPFAFGLWRRAAGTYKELKASHTATKRAQHELPDTSPETTLKNAKGEKKFFRGVFVGVLSFTILFGVFCTTQSVATKKVGIVKTFNKPEAGALGNGLQFKWPWQEISELDAAVQNDVFKTEGAQGDNGPIQVKLANESQAFVDVTVSWRIVPAAAHELYQNYKDDGSIRKNLVVRNLESVLLSNYAQVDPLASVDEVPATDKTGTEADKVAREDLSPVVFKQLQDRLDGKHTASTDDDKHLIKIEAVIVGTVTYDKATQAKLNDYQAAKADLRIAEQKEKTAKAEARANEAIAKSLTDPVIRNKCLDIWKEKGGSIPPYCFPGGTALSGIPANK